MTDQPTKKPITVICIASKSYMPYAHMMINSFHKFHDWPVILVTDETDPKKLPKDVIVEDLTPYLKDPMFYYRATPILGEKFLKEYECVIKIDADSIITGDLSYILDTKDYDVAGVLNYNKPDSEIYGLVGGWGIHPIEYWNAGFVVMRSQQFVHEWLVWCFSEQFDRLPMKEQDGLNAKVWHGNWNCRNLDHFDKVGGMRAWWGLFAKTYWAHAIMQDGKIIIPKDEEGLDTIRDADTELKVIHIATGNTPNKFGHLRTQFADEVADYLDELTK